MPNVPSISHGLIAVVLSYTVALPAAAQPPESFWVGLMEGDETLLTQTLDARTDIDAREPNVSTPLIVAAMFRQTALVRQLVDRGANLDLQNADGATALHVAALFAHPECLTVLIEARADPTLTNGFGLSAVDQISDDWNSDVEQTYDFIASIFQLDLDFGRLERQRPEARAVLEAAS